jgi:galactokinase
VAEWYVGTRGGKGDQAAIVLSKKGNLSHISFSPLKVEHLPFPQDYCVALCNTFREAKKSEGAKNIFNERVATYEIALYLAKERFSELSAVKMLRDINSQNFEIPYIYKILKEMPLRIFRKELEKQIPSRKNELAALYQTHEESKDGYRVRGVFLFGIAECERSRICSEFMKRGEVEKFGELMNISHNGDRVCEIVPEERDIDRLIKDKIPIYLQPGAYAVSCNEGDLLVDCSLKVPQVSGARLVGAGLGGYVAVLLKKDGVEELRKTLKEKYYDLRNLVPGIEICFPNDGLKQLKEDEC